MDYRGGLRPVSNYGPAVSFEGLHPVLIPRAIEYMPLPFLCNLASSRRFLDYECPSCKWSEQGYGRMSLILSVPVRRACEVFIYRNLCCPWMHFFTASKIGPDCRAWLWMGLARIFLPFGSVLVGSFFCTLSLRALAFGLLAITGRASSSIL